MPFATIDEIRARSSFKEEMASLSNDEVTSYLNRSGRWIYRATKVDYSTETDEGVLEDLKTATIHLVDYLWYWDNPDVKESMMGPFDNEKIGSYSYALKNLGTFEQAIPGEKTGIKELDSILDSLTPKVIGVNYFSVGGPSS